jgi:hypothetical protein
MLGIMTSLKMRLSLLAVATVLAAALVGASPASNAYASGGNTRNCTQTGGGGGPTDGLRLDHNVILSCILNNITVNITVGDVLSDNDVQVIDDVIVKDNDLCTSKGWDNNTCAVVILDDVTVKVLAFVNVVVKQIEVTVGDVKLIKKW